MERCLYCMEELYKGQEVCPACNRNVYVEKTEPYHITAGSSLNDRYFVGVSIEYRGESIIYAGYDNVLRQRVSVKEYFPLEYAVRKDDGHTVGLYINEFENVFNEGLRRFITEAKRLAKFRDNKGIVRILDIFEKNGTAYQIVDYVDGNRLSDIISKKGRLSIKETLVMLEPIAETLIKVHSEGVIHRNICPETIVIEKDGQARLIDFGAARHTSATNTKTLSVMIEPGFTPEEQYLSSGNQGAWTDVYAFAATIYKCITGVTPEESILRSKHDTLKRPSEYGIEIDDCIDDAIMHALSMDITKRTLTMSDFMEELHVGNKIIEWKPMGWRIYAVCCLLLWVVSLTLSSMMLRKSSDNNKKTLKEISTTAEDKIERHTKEIARTTEDLTSEYVVTTQYITTEQPKDVTDQDKIIITTERITEKNTVEKDVKKKLTEEKTTEKKKTKKKNTEEKTTKNVENTEQITEEEIFIED
ncbi:MAG: serine/threonine protein kinase [Lachnospiraceae bacterium]|nr:serine/threonine protein kinase [Lachnospiraceae bacterium]